MTSRKLQIDKLGEIELRKLSGLRLRQAREAKRLLMRDVVYKMAGVWENTSHVTRLQGYESGMRGMSILTARQLSKVLGVSAAWLLCVEDTVELSGADIAFLTTFEAAPEPTRKVIRDILKLGT